MYASVQVISSRYSYGVVYSTFSLMHFSV